MVKPTRFPMVVVMLPALLGAQAAKKLKKYIILISYPMAHWHPPLA
jgi:predicted ATPase